MDSPRIDQISDCFKQALREAIGQATSWPRVDDFLARSRVARSKLREELLRVEAHFRQQSAAACDRPNSAVVIDVVEEANSSVAASAAHRGLARAGAPASGVRRRTMKKDATGRFTGIDQAAAIASKPAWAKGLLAEFTAVATMCSSERLPSKFPIASC